MKFKLTETNPATAGALLTPLFNGALNLEVTGASDPPWSSDTSESIATTIVTVGSTFTGARGIVVGIQARCSA